MDLTRDESNRKIAEALGWKFESRVFNLIANEGDTETTPIESGLLWWPPGSPCNAPLPDFYLSEEASALVRDAMPAGTRIEKGHNGMWFVAIPHINNSYQWLPLMEAICEAYLAMLEKR